MCRDTIVIVITDASLGGETWVFVAGYFHFKSVAPRVRVMQIALNSVSAIARYACNVWVGAECDLRFIEKMFNIAILEIIVFKKSVG